MNRSELAQATQQNQSLLCVGLDPEPARLPTHLQQHPDGVYHFCKEIIEATTPYAIAYKINFAFFEAIGLGGWELLWRVRQLIPANTLAIADAKRGDIGNSSSAYARAIFEDMAFDAVTLSPYMGQDSIAPFLAYPGKWVFLLALTSNPGAVDFQLQAMGERRLFEQVVHTAERWPRAAELGYVAGATQAPHLAAIRALAPKAWLLVPGVGAQGGDLQAVGAAAATREGGLLINASRSILYAGNGPDYAQLAATEAQRLAKATAAFVIAK
jgi:orotidine-5'-phosphate decarboxylase